MVYNVDRFLSPTGGHENYEKNINTLGESTTILVASLFFSDQKLFNKYLGLPALKNFKYNTPEARAYRDTVRSFKNVAIPTLKGVPKFNPVTGVKTPEYLNRLDDLKTMGSYAKAEIQAAKNAPMSAATRAEQRSLMKAVKGYSKLARNVGTAMLLTMGVQLATEALTPGISKVAAKKEEDFMNGESTLLDSQSSYTMRQRAVMAIHDSMMNVRQVIGNEAQFLHR